MKQTPFYHLHRAAGAKVIAFGGYDMPVQYEGILSEHKTVRSAAGLFDVSHMGEIEIRGSGAAAFLQRLTTNDLGLLSPGKAQYSMMLYEGHAAARDGGVVDDLIVYKLSDERFLIIVNASNRDAVLSWMTAHLSPDVTLLDRSDDLSLLALQGPSSPDILLGLSSAVIGSLGYYHFLETEVAGVPMILARTGYTGEIGFELCFENRYADTIWNALFDAGEKYGLKPIGLGARDTLRLEMGYALYGHEIDAHTTPYEAGLGWVVKPKKGDFLGKDGALMSKSSPTKSLIGFEVEGRQVARQGYPIVTHTRAVVGTVASGTLSPSLERPIGTGFISPEVSRSEEPLFIEIRGQAIPIRRVKPPFYKKLDPTTT